MAEGSTILKHGPAVGADRLWIVAGTGEGPRLVRPLLTAGWRIRVSVVTREAAAAYPLHPRLQVRVGRLGGVSSVAAGLAEARRHGRPFRWLIDATHPFATAVSRELREACRREAQPLIRLQRPAPAAATGPGGDAPPATLLADIAELGRLDLRGERLLLAIGSRGLRAARQAARGAVCHARVLPRPHSLQLALAAGIPPERLACLQPGRAEWAGAGVLEAALCRHWRITAVLFRQSGGAIEGLWHELAIGQGMRRLMLRRPSDPPGPYLQLREESLLQWLLSPDTDHGPAADAGTGAHHRGLGGAGGAARP
jgi:precorrin-6A/cobalt-precorrin-6A reductase